MQYKKATRNIKILRGILLLSEGGDLMKTLNLNFLFTIIFQCNSFHYYRIIVCTFIQLKLRQKRTQFIVVSEIL